MRQAMEEEHKKDLAALARVQRFLDTPPAASTANGAHEHPVGPQAAAAAPPIDEEAPGEEQITSLIGAALDVVRSRPELSFSPRTVLQALEAQKFPLVGDEHRRLVSIGQSLKKLATRNDIRLVRHGKGREPNVYRALKTREALTSVPAGASEMRM